MTKLKTFFIYFLGICIFIIIGWFANTAYHLPRTANNPIAEVRPTPLAKYTIENLSKAQIPGSQIVIGKVLKTDPKYTSYEFILKFSPDLSGNLKTTSGLINIPAGTGPFPVIVMYRGYVDPSQYFIGDGTSPAARVFAANGFITVAPDFLGYGDSDHEATDVFESRFQTYTTAVAVLNSINSIKQWDNKNVFIWGHSNGGQVTLTTLEITGINYPTVLWAPVSAEFPYSILFYTDEASDGGKFLRRQLADFENDYGVEPYSLTNYISNIKAPIQLNQGTADPEVPVAWSDQLNTNLKAAGVDVTYIKYPGADHDLQPSWNLAVINALDFYKKHIK
jgi:dipeptidyl aminopeptidase/acylaminoacyl peptidase